MQPQNLMHRQEKTAYVHFWEDLFSFILIFAEFAEARLEQQTAAGPPGETGASTHRRFGVGLHTRTDSPWTEGKSLQLFASYFSNYIDTLLVSLEQMPGCVTHTEQSVKLCHKNISERHQISKHTMYVFS